MLYQVWNSLQPWGKTSKNGLCQFISTQAWIIYSINKFSFNKLFIYSTNKLFSFNKLFIYSTNDCFYSTIFIYVTNYSCIQQIRIKQKDWPRKFPYGCQNAKLTNLVSKCSARFLGSLRHFDTRKLYFKGLNLLQRDFIIWRSNCTAF